MTQILQHPTTKREIVQQHFPTYWLKYSGRVSTRFNRDYKEAIDYAKLGKTKFTYQQWKLFCEKAFPPDK